MKEKIGEILISKTFDSWLKDPAIVKRLIEGGRGRNQREIILRNKIFDELDIKYPGIYKKEEARIDLNNPHSKILCEFGHNGLWQPSIYHINKPVSDFYKRANKFIFKEYYSVHFISDIVAIDPSHNVGISYLKPGQYSLGILRIIKNRNIALFKLETIKNDFEKIDVDYKIHNFQNLIFKGSRINIYALIVGPFVKSDWGKMQKLFIGELDIVEKELIIKSN